MALSGLPSQYPCSCGQHAIQFTQKCPGWLLQYNPSYHSPSHYNKFTACAKSKKSKAGNLSLLQLMPAQKNLMLLMVKQSPGQSGLCSPQYPTLHWALLACGRGAPTSHHSTSFHSWFQLFQHKIVFAPFCLAEIILDTKCCIFISLLFKGVLSYMRFLRNWK